MGIIDPMCAASNSGRTAIYTLSSVPSYGSSTTMPGSLYRQFLVISKSNNSSVFDDITWTTVAAADIRAFPELKTLPSCVVDDKGVFTIFGHYIVNSSDYKPVVIRYDPSAPKTALKKPNGEDVESTGPGSWMNITVSDSYAWPTGTKSMAFYTKGAVAGGAQKLMHLFYTSAATTLSFGIVDETNKTLSFAANWTTGISSKIKSVAYGNQELYVYWSPDTASSKLSVYTLASLSSTIPPNPRELSSAMATSECTNSPFVLSGTLGNSHYMTCAYGSGTSVDLFSTEDTSVSGNNFGSGRGTTWTVPHADHFIPINGTTEYAFIMDAARYTGTYCMGLTGLMQGKVWGPKDIIVPETFGRDPLERPKSSSPNPNVNDPRSHQTSLSTGAIIGIVIGILALLAIAGYCFWRRPPNSSDEKKKRAAETTVNHIYTQGHHQTEVVRKSGQATQFIVRPAEATTAQTPGINGPYQLNATGQPHAGAYPQMPGQPMYPTPQPAPIAISDARAIPLATAAPILTTPQFQPVQDQMQHLQFSSHPRPNFVTSVGSQQHEIKSGPNSTTSASINMSS